MALLCPSSKTIAPIGGILPPSERLFYFTPEFCPQLHHFACLQSGTPRTIQSLRVLTSAPRQRDSFYSFLCFTESSSCETDILYSFHIFPPQSNCHRSCAGCNYIAVCSDFIISSVLHRV